MMLERGNIFCWTNIALPKSRLTFRHTRSSSESVFGIMKNITSFFKVLLFTALSDVKSGLQETSYMFSLIFFCYIAVCANEMHLGFLQPCLPHTKMHCTASSPSHLLSERRKPTSDIPHTIKQPQKDSSGQMIPCICSARIHFQPPKVWLQQLF